VINAKLLHNIQESQKTNQDKKNIFDCDFAKAVQEFTTSLSPPTPPRLNFSTGLFDF
jgi:hypothetical protein